MLRAILLCSACLAVGALRPAPSTRPARHWDNWIYLKEAHHWHTLWCRWKPSGEEILPAVLARYEDASGEGDALSATLEPESLQAVPFGACRVASASDEDVILLCADDTVAIIAPKRVPSAPFSICAVWADGAGAPPAGSANAGAGGACTIEALWDGGCESAHKLESVRHLRFAAP